MYYISEASLLERRLTKYIILNLLLWLCFLHVVLKVNQPCIHYKKFWELTKILPLKKIVVVLVIIFNDSGFFQTHYKATYMLYGLSFSEFVFLYYYSVLISRVRNDILQPTRQNNAFCIFSHLV